MTGKSANGWGGGRAAGMETVVKQISRCLGSLWKLHRRANV